MVDRSELGTANMLFSRYQQYQVALALKDPRIVSFTLEGEGQESSDPEAGTETMQLTVSSEGITTPPQMLTAIKDQIEQRIKHINEQLNELGVAETSAAPAASLPPRAAPHKPEPPKHEPHKPPPRNTRR